MSKNFGESPQCEHTSYSIAVQPHMRIIRRRYKKYPSCVIPEYFNIRDFNQFFVRSSIDCLSLLHYSIYVYVLSSVNFIAPPTIPAFSFYFILFYFILSSFLFFFICSFSILSFIFHCTFCIHFIFAHAHY